MFTNEWLKKTQEKYSTSDDIHPSNYQHLLDYFLATGSDTPKYMTAGLLKRLLTGTSVDEVSRIIGLATQYNKLLELYYIYDDKASKLKEIAANSSTEEEKEKLLSEREIALEKREAYWTSMQIMCVPLTQICFDIGGSKYIWCVETDRIL